MLSLARLTTADRSRHTNCDALKAGAEHMSEFAGIARPRLRLQFSLASFLLVTAASAVAIWAWYRRPYRVEREVVSLDWICTNGMSSQEIAAFRAQPPQFREVQYMRRVKGGKSVRHGAYRAYDLQRNLVRSGYYRDDQADGKFILYAPGGQRLIQQTYVRGLAHGERRRWSGKGQLLTQQEYKNDKEHGFSREWHSNGVLVREENYQDGQRDGTFAIWDASGTQVVTGAYQQDLPHGRWTWFPGGGPIASISGQWWNGLADGRWEWEKADGDCYLAAVFDRGRVVQIEPDLLSPRVVEEFVRTTSANPEKLARDFTIERSILPGTKLVDVHLMILRKLYLGHLPDASILPRHVEAVVAPAALGTDPLPVAYAKLLRQEGLGYDLRYGEIVIDGLEAIARWQDHTGMHDVIPPLGSKLGTELDRSTDVDVVDMPLGDLLTYVREKHEISVQLRDTQASQLSDAPPAADPAVTLEMRNVLLRDALGKLLAELRYKASLDDDVLIVEPQ